MSISNKIKIYKQYFACLIWGVLLLVVELICLYYAVFCYVIKPSYIPLISSDSISCKIRPRSTGGAKILNSDKTIYDKIQRTKDTSNQKIKILPLPEKPISITPAINSTSNSDKIEYNLDQIKVDYNNKESNNNLHTTKYKKIKDSNYDDVAHLNLHIVILSQPDSRLQDLLSNPLQLYKPPIKYRLLLGSSYNVERAHNLWQQILEENHKILNRYSYIIHEIYPDSNQVVYNILAGDFNNLSDALRMCKKLISNQQTCLVVRY